MFSAVYMVCAMELGGCMFFVDQLPYQTMEECQLRAMEQIAVNQLRVENKEMIPHTATFKCFGWEDT